MAASTAKRGSEGRRAVASAAGKESHGSFDSEGRRAMMASTAKRGIEGRHRREAAKGGKPVILQSTLMLGGTRSAEGGEHGGFEGKARQRREASRCVGGGEESHGGYNGEERRAIASAANKI